MSLRYSASVEWSEEDGEFVALCPEFPGSSGSGDTGEEALSQLQESIRLLLETYEAQRIKVPAPRVMEEFSGQVRLRLPKELHRELATAAEHQGVSLNTLFVTYLAAGLGRASEQSELLAQLMNIVAKNPRNGSAKELIAHVKAPNGGGGFG